MRFLPSNLATMIGVGVLVGTLFVGGVWYWFLSNDSSPTTVIDAPTLDERESVKDEGPEIGNQLSDVQVPDVEPLVSENENESEPKVSKSSSAEQVAAEQNPYEDAPVVIKQREIKEDSEQGQQSGSVESSEVDIQGGSITSVHQLGVEETSRDDAKKEKSG